MFDRKECKRKAREALKGKYKAPVLIGLVNFVLVLAFYAVYFIRVMAFVNEGRENFVGTYITMLCLCIGFCLVMPIFLFAYKKNICDLLKGKEISIKTYFGDFKYIKKAQGLFWWTYLQLFWRMLVVTLVFVVFVLVMSLLGKATGSILVFLAIARFVVLIAAYVFMIRLLISYSMNWYICANNPSIGCIDATRYSVKITKNNLGKIFVMDLSFIGWFLLSYLTLGILFLWVMPYYEATRFFALEQLSEEANNSEGDSKAVEASAPADSTPASDDVNQ